MGIEHVGPEDVHGATPKRAPSGRAATRYGQIRIDVWHLGDGPDSDSAEVAIGALPGSDMSDFICATEHLMTLVAMNSKAGFEKALELLVEGAISNRGKRL